MRQDVSRLRVGGRGLEDRSHAEGICAARLLYVLLASLVVCAVAVSLSPRRPDNAGFMAGDDPKTDGGTWSEEYHSDPR